MKFTPIPTAVYNPKAFIHARGVARSEACKCPLPKIFDCSHP